MIVLINGEATGYVTLTMLLPLFSHFGTVFLQKHFPGSIILCNLWPRIHLQGVRSTKFKFGIPELGRDRVKH